MDSEESRPGSSASNSSTNSSENSRQSPSPTNEMETKSPPANLAVASPQNSAGDRRSRPRSRSSNEGMNSPRSLSKSDSDSSSSSSSSDNEDDAKSAVSALQVKSNNFSDHSNSDGSLKNNRISEGSRNQSASPATKSRQSSRNTSSSSNNSCSRSNSRDKVLCAEADVNISHEDLSDVSDMESEKRASSFNNSKQSLEDDGTNNSMSATVIEDKNELIHPKCNYISEGDNSQDAVITDLRQKLDQKKNLRTTEVNIEKPEDLANNNENVSGETIEDLVKTHDEDSLDFEAEEGECQEISKDEGDINRVIETEKKNNDENSDGEAEEGEELEEGEVSDEDEKRPEETEPKPVCRFYTRGQCTWGMSCRFLHPGVTDKGNYTMFDLVRPVPVPQPSTSGSRASTYVPHATADYHDYRTERPQLHHRTTLHHSATVFPSHHEARTLLPDGPVVVESAWERGLRTAKEMMRKANKRKEQDMDFEDKKMNLTLSPDELEKDPFYLKDRGSPQDVVPPYGRHAVYQEAVTAAVYSSADRFGRGPPVPQSYDEVDPYGRTTRYRELPPHRMPQYEDERRVRPTREVIVQRVETVGRGDEWNDPWMRSKSPGGGRGVSRDRGDKQHRDRRSYSSNSSYSSSSSSQSDSSSDSSRSPSPGEHKRRYNNSSRKTSPPARRHNVRSVRSPSPPSRRSKRSPSGRHSSIKRRENSSLSPALDKRSAYSPVPKRKKQSPILKKSLNEKSKTKRNHTSSSSGSGSSDSSASDSDSDTGSSTSDSSSLSKRHTPLKRSRATEKIISERKVAKKVEPLKKRSPISIEIKKQATVGASALTSPTHSISSEKDTKKSRREELLKQLRAVEDAIAKKRSKLA